MPTEIGQVALPVFHSICATVIWPYNADRGSITWGKYMSTGQDQQLDG
ncbi:hypothetical protein EC912_102718 [Luteibacter rhizovicinus]|uniref:Uncharacterized protein n=1 Tax=Luteibacter rhizovicinus TaxID=242606 RepID=A0A4R3YTT5_9GAMM|nr:hypothetical protein EC912_102718 [Luteibacter rhizovicinus]